MPEQPTRDAIALVRAAADALGQRKAEVDKLNVFPVPDGDTGTNMALTMDSVIAELDRIAQGAPLAEVCHAITHGSLMGARGNSGVILSQILRGLCDVVGRETELSAATITEALRRSATVAFQAVRKPVEGTMLTVLKDAAAEAEASLKDGDPPEAMLERVVKEAFASVERGPDLLPVLKENGVVDAGGYGLAIMARGFVEAMEGRALDASARTLVEPSVGPRVVPIEDWDDEEHLYCTEFLLLGSEAGREDIHDAVAGLGGSELVVGDEGEFKVHVHTDDPAAVLAYATSLGEIAEVHVNNMRRQSRRRRTILERESSRAAKEVGFVAVAAGVGLEAILRSLGVDEVVSGGQTMNPSTAELLEAVERVDAEEVVVLPNNRNIILAAQQVPALSERPVHVVPTTAVPQAFAAMLAYDPSVELADSLADMQEAATAVRTGEVTVAVKDAAGKTGPIRSGQVIGIADHEVEVVGDDIGDVTSRLLDLLAPGGETLTLLAGEDLPERRFEEIAARLQAAHPELEVETHVGGQPLYPMIIAVE